MGCNKRTDPSMTIAITFAKDEKSGFDRCAFPILGRPVVFYPLWAAVNSESITKTFFSSNSEHLFAIAKNISDVEIIRRSESHQSIIAEFKSAVQMAAKSLGRIPMNTAILLGNSPCVLAQTIDSAVSILDKKTELTSVVTAVKRPDFRVRRAFRLTDAGLLCPFASDNEREYSHFIDSNIIVARTQNLLDLKEPYDDLNKVLGDNICPLFQEEGISDIDYAWQVPSVERWLTNNGFSEKETPYDSSTQPKSSQLLPTTDAGEQTKCNVLVTTVPFGQIDCHSIELLEQEPLCNYVINPLGRKLKEDELAEMICDYDIIVAGTEPITRKVLKKAKRLKLISRVGIGLDSVDLAEAKERGILVSYTPDAPAPAVAELAIGHMLNMCRFIAFVDRKMREGVWQRKMGQLLRNQTIGIIGTGRIGSRVLKHLQGFSPERILVNDVLPNDALYELYNAEHVSKETIYKNADIITLHIPLAADTYHLVAEKEISLMKKTSMLINTSRGGIINEKDLVEALRTKKIKAAAIDVFEDEPYGGELVTLDNCFFTCHMGSCTEDCRFEMERLAVEEALRFIHGQELKMLVPELEMESE